MAHASKKHVGVATGGKRDGTGALGESPLHPYDNQVLSNRDKKRHSEQRGLDSKTVQTEQRQDHTAHRYRDE
jgi:hypothetical protein